MASYNDIRKQQAAREVAPQMEQAAAVNEGLVQKNAALQNYMNAMRQAQAGDAARRALQNPNLDVSNIQPGYGGYGETYYEEAQYPEEESGQVMTYNSSLANSRRTPSGERTAGPNEYMRLLAQRQLAAENAGREAPSVTDNQELMDSPALAAYAASMRDR